MDGIPWNHDICIAFQVASFDACLVKSTQTIIRLMDSAQKNISFSNQ